MPHRRVAISIFGYAFSFMPNSARRTASQPTLSRDLGASHATAVVIGTIIGSGIFLVPAEMMQAVGSARSSIWCGSSADCCRCLAP